MVGRVKGPDFSNVKSRVDNKGTVRPKEKKEKKPIFNDTGYLKAVKVRKRYV